MSLRNPSIRTQLLHFTPQSQAIHGDNVLAGWWSDITTGQSIVATRNRGELMMLMVSELSEASDGYRLGLYDDKLPHRHMIEVELADAKIRILDAGGADNLDLTSAAFEVIEGGFTPVLPNTAQTAEPLLIDAELMVIVNQISRAMESHRKKLAPDACLPLRSGYEVGLATALLLIHEVGYSLGLDVDGAVAEKRAFNATRADHKIENRRAAGGKTY
jgi:hypothetical protein